MSEFPLGVITKGKKPPPPNKKNNTNERKRMKHYLMYGVQLENANVFFHL